jgi:hypothetical protein
MMLTSAILTSALSVAMLTRSTMRANYPVRIGKGKGTSGCDLDTVHGH